MKAMGSGTSFFSVSPSGLSKSPKSSSPVSLSVSHSSWWLISQSSEKTDVAFISQNSLSNHFKDYILTWHVLPYHQKCCPTAQSNLMSDLYPCNEREKTMINKKTLEALLVFICIVHASIASCAFYTSHIWNMGHSDLQPDTFPCRRCTGGRRGSWSHTPLWTRRPRTPRCCRNPSAQHSDHNPGDASLCDC